MTTLSTNANLLDLLPPWYAEVADYQAICNAEQPVFEQIQAYIMQVLNNFFPQTMDVGAVAQWEQVLGILANPSTEDLAFRQYRIINRISTKPPFTLQFLYNKLDELIGPGAWTVDVDYPNYTLYIESNAQTQEYSQEVEFTVNRIKPAHIAYIHRAVVASNVLVGESIQYTRYQWNYLLGSWSLGQLPFAQVIENEVVKTPSMSSVQPLLLNNLTDYTAADIVSARVNGSIAVSDIQTVQDGNVITVIYPVSQAQTGEITQVELLDASGNALVSANVYIPVVDTVSVKHTITIAEGGVTSAGT